MKFTSLKKNKKASNISLILMLSAVVLFFFAAGGLAHGVAFVQLIGVLFLAGSAYYMMRAMTIYTYIVIPNDDDSDKDVSKLSPERLSFIVSKRFGKGREIYQCQLDLSTLISVKEFPADRNEQKKILAPLGKVNLYRYDATVGKHGSLLLVFHKRGQEKICIVAEPVDGMYGYLKNVAGINRKTPEE